MLSCEHSFPISCCGFSGLNQLFLFIHCIFQSLFPLAVPFCLLLSLFSSLSPSPSKGNGWVWKPAALSFGVNLEHSRYCSPARGWLDLKQPHPTDSFSRLHLALGFFTPKYSPCCQFPFHTQFLLSKHNSLFFIVEFDDFHFSPFHWFSKNIWNLILAGESTANRLTVIQSQPLQAGSLFLYLSPEHKYYLKWIHGSTPKAWLWTDKIEQDVLISFTFMLKGLCLHHIYPC